MALVPTIAGTNGGNRTTDATSHTVNLPASIASGDLLIAIVTFDGNPTVTWPAGWTSLHAGAAASNTARIEARYRVANGSEGSSISLTTSASEMFCYDVLRITDYTGTPEASTGATGTSTAPLADALNPAAWGTEDALWLHVSGYDQGQRFVDNTGDLIRTGTLGAGGANPNQRADNASGCGQAVYSEWRTASSHNGRPATLSTGDEWRAFTVAIRSSGSSGSGGVRVAGYAG